MNNTEMLYGAAVGDTVGSTYEWNSTKDKQFDLLPQYSHFTDDTLLTVAIANAVITGTPYLDNIIKFGLSYRSFPVGFGSSFEEWLTAGEHLPYNSWGNGSAMRVSPIGWAFNSEEEVLHQAKLSAEITHNHPEGVKGAQSVALAIYMARTGSTKEKIRARLTTLFEYDLTRTVDDIRPTYTFQVGCALSVPEAIIAFLDSTSYEDAIRNAVSLGGDADTQAAITGSIAEAFYDDVSEDLLEEVAVKLPLELFGILQAFSFMHKRRTNDT